MGIEEFLLNRAKKEGLKEGFEKGIEQGIEKGIEQGVEKGIQKAKREMIQKLLLDQAYTVEQIAEMATVSTEFVLDIKRGLEQR